MVKVTANWESQYILHSQRFSELLEDVVYSLSYVVSL